MSIHSRIVQMTYVCIYKYMQLFTALSDILFKPIINLFKKLSPSLGKGLENILKPFQKFLMTTPFFAIILGLSAYIFNDYEVVFNSNGYTILQDVDIFILGFIIVFFLGLVYTVYNITVSNKNKKESIRNGSIICLSSIPIIALNQPQSYAYIITLCYAIGAYTTTVIKFQYPTNQVKELIDENTGIMNYVHIIAYISIIFSFLIGISFLNLLNRTSSIELLMIPIFILTVLLGLSAYGFTKLQQNTYEKIYEHSLPTKSSRFYLFPSRIAIVYATTSILLAQSVTVLSGLLFFIPAIMYIKFSRYISRTKEMQIGEDIPEFMYEHNKNSRSRYKAQDGKKPVVDELEYNHSVSEDGGATLDLNMSIKIPKEQVSMYNPWKYLLQTTANVNDIIDDLQTVDNNDAKKITNYDAYYTDVSRIGAKEMIQSLDGQIEFPFDEWPDKLSNNVREQLYNMDETTMDDIVDAQIKMSGKDEDIEFNKFADKF